MGRQDRDVRISLQTSTGAGSLPRESHRSACRRRRAQAQRARVRHAVSHPAAARVRRLVRQPLGSHRPFERRPPAPPALSPHLLRTGTRQRSVREPRSRCSSMNSHVDRVAQRLHQTCGTPGAALPGGAPGGGVARGHGRAAHQRLRACGWPIGCRWAASVIAQEHGTPNNLRPRLARGAKAVAAYAPAGSHVLLTPQRRGDRHPRPACSASSTC